MSSEPTRHISELIFLADQIYQCTKSNSAPFWNTQSKKPNVEKLFEMQFLAQEMQLRCWALCGGKPTHKHLAAFAMDRNLLMKKLGKRQSIISSCTEIENIFDIEWESIKEPRVHQPYDHSLTDEKNNIKRYSRVVKKKKEQK